MTASRFRAVQAALFAALAFIPTPITGTDPSLTRPEDDTIPTVPRHLVLRRHLQGHPAFTIGALGGVGMHIPDHDFESFAEAIAARVVEFFEADQAFNSFHYHNIMDHHSNATSRLVWTGDLKRSSDKGAHLRYQQYFDNQPVEGGNIVVHTDSAGNIVAVNGEYVDCRQALSLPSRMFMNPYEAVQVALASLRIDNSNDLLSQTEPDLALVVQDDFSCCLAHKTTVVYWQDDGDDGLMKKQDVVYANVVNGNICAREPLVMGQFSSLFSSGQSPKVRGRVAPSLPVGTRRIEMEQFPNDTQRNGTTVDNTTPGASISTYFCVPWSNDTEIPPRQGDCTLISNSSNPISTGYTAIDSAHNYALATFEYFWHFHGLNSLNGYGFELISYVLSEEFAVANGPYTLPYHEAANWVHLALTYCSRLTFCSILERSLYDVWEW